MSRRVNTCTSLSVPNQYWRYPASLVRLRADRISGLFDVPTRVICSGIPRALIVLTWAPAHGDPSRRVAAKGYFAAQFPQQRVLLNGRHEGADRVYWEILVTPELSLIIHQPESCDGDSDISSVGDSRD